MPYRPPYAILSPLILTKARILETIASVISYSFTMAETNHGARTTEVDRLLYFFVEGLPVLESSLRRLLRPHHVDVTISGIFCHKTPMVRSTAPRASAGSCELSDLAFIATYGRIINSDGLGNAFLTQAKNRLGQSRSNDQELLYEETNRFEYTSPTLLSQVDLPNSRERDISRARNAFWYWELGPRGYYPDYFGAYQQMSRGIPAYTHRTPPIYSTPFELALFDLFAGINGKGFHKMSGNSHEQRWSRVVDDILRVTAGSLVRTGRTGYVVRSQGQLRGYEARRAITAVTGNAAYLARCSIGEFFALIDEEMTIYGKKMEEENARFDTDAFRKEIPDETAKADVPNEGGKEPPTFDNDNVWREKGDEGNSFVRFDFRTKQVDDNDGQTTLAL